jgi:putative membrane protein
MPTASDAVNAAQRLEIEAAVTAAESRTSCEIVPVVATVSGRYDRSEDLVGMWLATVGAIVVWLILPRDRTAGGWSNFPVWGEVLILALSIVVCFVAGAVAASRSGTLRRLFTPRRHMSEEVNLRARQLFFDRRVHHTTGASGILIYVSLHEHVAVVLGDRTVVDCLGESFLEGLCQRLTSDLRKRTIAESLCDVIQHATPALEKAMPRTEADANELPDALVLID